MFLVSAKVGPFKSIDAPQTVKIEETITALVGMNEAGKTVFLKALEKSGDALGMEEFDPVDDYPRKDLPQYLKQHKTAPAEVVTLRYRLTSTELAEVNSELGIALKQGFEFTVTHKYDNKRTIGIDVDEKPVLKSLLTKENFSSDALTAAKHATSLREIPERLADVALTDDDTAQLEEIKARIAKHTWTSVVQSETWNWLSPRVPKFLYFSDYDLLPSKMNLADLAQRVEQAKTDGKHLQPKHRALLALLRMADISIADFTKPGGYEQLKAKIEGVSISLTDQIMEFWKQNENLEVEVDIKADPDDEAPFDNGANLYLRIKNRRHRGVSTPFQQRSRGFIWFFSFLVWFDSVQHQLDPSTAAAERDLILLLDEPGLALHALAQSDFLRYIDRLAKAHQVLYTTHSPFMIHSDRLNLVRVVEDKDKIGTVISDSLSDSDPRTIFPLQAALGWTIAQNLFISKRNLLVEGPSDLIYLRAISTILDANGEAGLRDDVTIVPVGGLDKVATFIALLGANELELAVLYDYRGAPDQRLTDLVKQKIIAPKLLLNASQFRDVAKIGTSGPASDTEDLFEPQMYLDHFNRTYSKQLGKTTLSESTLPAGDRIIDRIERFLQQKGIQVRPSGGFNHYAVASHFASHPPKSLDVTTMNRFSALFESVNALFSK